MEKNERELMHEFNRYYHRLTPHMIVLYNAEYQDSGWDIKESYTEKELFEYVTMAKNAGKLEEMIEFVKNLV